MSGDYTRFSFDPVNVFSGVHKQQGRVSLDSEFNEFEEILDRRDRAGTYDTLGQAVTPMTTPDGFKIGGTLAAPTIGVGRAYVDGILAECFGDLATTDFDKNLGRVHGGAPVAYGAQPFFYAPGFPALPATVGDIVYLDVWQREVGAYEDPTLREVALNGPDTATRVQTAWQVKILSGIGAKSCATPLPATLTDPSTARLSAQAAPAAPAPGPCVINPAGGYTGLENRLYRVEIQDAGTLGGAATFKWSRDNASLQATVLAVKVLSLTESVITVSSTGRDSWMRFEHGDHLELLDDDVELAMRETGHGGRMATVLSVNHATGEIHVDKDLTGFVVDPKRHPRIRRWDIASAAEKLVRPATNGVAIPLEEGISVTFGASAADTLHAGDYWVFAARTVDGSIETLTNEPPRGVLHHFYKLAVATGGTPPFTDCRVFWPAPGGGGGGGDHEGCCSQVVKVGDDIQKAIDSLPPDGGCVCLKTGTHTVKSPPLRIMNSNVVLHGESIGAHVLSPDSRQLLIIGGGETPVTDVDVHDIRFETSSESDSGTDEAIVGIVNARRVAVHRCEITSSSKLKDVDGIVISGSQDVRIESNVIDVPFEGVLATEGCRLLAILDNRIRGLTGDGLDAGVVGISLEVVTGACRLENNRIEGFVEGIHLSGSTTEGSVIAANRITRHAPLSPSGSQWGIDVVRAPGCTIRDNSIDVAEADQGGIQVGGGAGCVVEGNDINNVAKPAGALGTPPLGAGIRLEGATGSLVSANRIRGIDEGIRTEGGTAERFLDNQVGSGGDGILALDGSALLIANNIIEDMMRFGIGVAKMAETTTITTNRLVRCAGGEKSRAAIDVQNPAGDAPFGEVVIELNDVLDTGIVAVGDLAAPVFGINLTAARCRIQSNHVTYANPAKLRPDLESRALRLDGVQAQTKIGEATNDWALILDNSFVGPGQSALVEILPKKVRLDRVTFGNNYCEHYTKEGNKGATVSLFAVNVIVQGNHVKAPSGVPSYQLKASKAIFLGNNSTGTVLGAVTPPLPNAFNIP